MAIGQSRYEVKRAAREQNPSAWSVSDHKIHAHLSRARYQGRILAFLNWARQQESIRTLEQLDPQASTLLARYLSERLAAGQTPATVQSIRAALRIFFDDDTLADEVQVPRREREKITRSRGPAKRDSHFQAANWTTLIEFLKGTGLRGSEIKALQVRDVRQNEDGRAEVFVVGGKGGKQRTVTARKNSTELVLAAVAGREPLERVFPQVPDRINSQALRREFAQQLYMELSGRPLPPKEGRLKRSDYDREAALLVSHQLGHNRVDVMLRSYLR